MSTFSRVPPTGHFLLISNDAARDPEISFKAKGVLGKMLSFEPGWVFRRSHLQKLSTNKRISLDNSIEELINAGYVVQNQQKRSADGRWSDTHYEVYDQRPTARRLPPTEVLDPSPALKASTADANLSVVSDNLFVRIRNAAMRDPLTSDKAKGLLVCMLSFPRGWEFSQTYLQRFATDKEVSIATGLNELIKAGYIIRGNQKRGEAGTFGALSYLVADYRIGTCEDPNLDTHHSATVVTAPGKPAHGDNAVLYAEPPHPPAATAPGKPAPGKPAPGKPAPGKPAPKKTVGKKTVNKKTISSRRARATGDPRPAEQDTTTHDGNEKGLSPRITKTLKGLLSTLFNDEPHRIEAWPALGAEQQEEAFQRAQERKKKGDPKAFSTLLKEELDTATGLKKASSDQASVRPPHFTTDKAAWVEAALDASKEAYYRAREEGLDRDEAERRESIAFEETMRRYRESRHGPHAAKPDGASRTSNQTKHD